MTNFEWLKTITIEQFAEWFCNNLDRAMVCGAQNQYCNTDEEHFIKWLNEQKNSDVAKNNLIEILEHRIKELEIQNEKLEAKAKNAIEAYKATEKDLIQCQIENVALQKRLNNAVELPCKVGDSIYQYDNAGRIYESKIKNIIYDTTGIAFDERAINNSIFLTRDEIEAHLIKIGLK